MLDIPAVCMRCGAVFPSSLGSFSGDVTIELFGNTSNDRCPRCGALGMPLDGTIRFREDLVEILSAGPVSSIGIRRLKRVVSAAISELERSSDTEPAANLIKEQAPELKKFSDVIPKTRIQLYTLLLVLLGALTFLESAFDDQPEKPPSHIEIQQQIDNAINQALQDRLLKKPNQTAPTEPKPPSKPGRNAPCPCGSGKRYKHCCGRMA